MERSLTVDLPVEQVARVVKRHLVLQPANATSSGSTTHSEQLPIASQIPRQHQRRNNHSRRRNNSDSRTSRQLAKQQQQQQQQEDNSNNNNNKRMIMRRQLLQVVQHPI